MDTVAQSAVAPSLPPDPEMLLAPLREAARHSSSLISTRVDFAKFLLLGQRGGGVPIKLALFGGVRPGEAGATAAVARLLLQWERRPALARDFAIFGYPLVAPPDDDLGFYRAELEKWSFDGLVTLRVQPRVPGFQVRVRSEVIARELASPIRQALSAAFPLDPDAPPAAARWLAKLEELRPAPFELEIAAPGSLGLEEQTAGLALAVEEVLRQYRRMISHAANL